MKAGIIGVVVIILGAIAATFYFINQSPTTPLVSEEQNPSDKKMVIENTETVDSIKSIGSDSTADKQASFAIFTNGTFREFSAPMYHNLSDDAFIENKNPNIIQVKKEVTWDAFFKTLPFKLTKDCLTTGTGQTFCTGKDGSLKFYLNGQLDNEALSKTINQGDKLLVSFGNEEAQITGQLERIPNP